ncbi:MAG TPA: hypothetical protein VJN72_14590 [Gaiellales bacterium]|nr:hypothetical protein [Gaiellales bacterium]
MGHHDGRADLEHCQVAAPERRAVIRRRHQAAHACHERLRGPGGLLRVVRVQRLVDRDDELGQRAQPREPEALRGDLQELGAAQPSAVPLEVDALGLEQLPVQVEQERAQCGEIVGDARIVAVAVLRRPGSAAGAGIRRVDHRPHEADRRQGLQRRCRDPRERPEGDFETIATGHERSLHGAREPRGAATS